jgi:hypothetical protein
MSTRVNLYLRDSAVSILSRVPHKGSLVSHLVARAYNKYRAEEFVRTMLSDKVISLVEDILAYTDFVNRLAKDTDDIRYTIDWANAHQWFTDGTDD